MNESARTAGRSQSSSRTAATRSKDVAWRARKPASAVMASPSTSRASAPNWYSSRTFRPAAISCTEDRFHGLLPIVVLDLADRLEADRARWLVGHATQHCRSFRLGRSFACIAVAVVRPGAVEHGGILPFELAVVEHPTLAQAAEALQ